MIKTKRIYDYSKENKKKRYNNSGDEFKILVDKLWPRGLSKDEVKMDLWLKDIAPSNNLRKWFAHDPKKWEKFKLKYKEELMDDSEKIKLLKQIKQTEKEKGDVILMYAAKDQEHNNAVALIEFLREL
jgi:uncharacterized protein YeaO (DUF488 family)